MTLEEIMTGVAATLDRVHADSQRSLESDLLVDRWPVDQIDEILRTNAAKHEKDRPAFLDRIRRAAIAFNADCQKPIKDRSHG